MKPQRNPPGTWRTLVGCASLLLAAAGPALADTLHVPSQFPTIQAAVDAAVDGDTVIVADGIYTGPGPVTVMVDKAITLRSENGPTNCIIDAAFEGIAVYMGCGVTLTGFTIRNALSSEGGGIRNARGGTTISDCIITGNSAPNGGGVYCASGPVTISGCIIANNSATDWDPQHMGFGGGVYLGGYDSCMYDCFIADNTANWGGGVWVMSGANIVSCEINGNAAIYGGGGLGAASLAHVADCVVTGNRSALYGGGLYADNAGWNVCNVTIAGNQADWYGGGAYLCHCWGEFTNTILSDDTAAYGAELALEDHAFAFAFYCNVEGGDAAVWVSGASYVSWVAGNIAADPLFVDPDSGDYRLRFDSPCIDSGSVDPNFYSIRDICDIDGDGDVDEFVPFDLTGNPRTCRFHVDMGAYEVPFADLNCDKQINFDDIDPFVLALADPAAYQATYATCNVLLADCNADGAIDFADIIPFVALLSSD